MIRWDGPLQMFERWVLDDGVEIAGHRLRVGDRIGMLFGSANRDPARFPDPDRFDVGRGDAHAHRLRRRHALLHRRAAGPAGDRDLPGPAAAGPHRACSWCGRRGINRSS